MVIFCIPNCRRRRHETTRKAMIEIVKSEILPEEMSLRHCSKPAGDRQFDSTRMFCFILKYIYKFIFELKKIFPPKCQQNAWNISIFLEVTITMIKMFLFHFLKISIMIWTDGLTDRKTDSQMASCWQTSSK